MAISELMENRVEDPGHRCVHGIRSSVHSEWPIHLIFSGSVKNVRNGRRFTFDLKDPSGKGVMTGILENKHGIETVSTYLGALCGCKKEPGPAKGDPVNSETR
jgi:hypothetical protein